MCYRLDEVIIHAGLQLCIFAKVFSKGIIKPNMTKIAKILFEPVISLGDCVNRHGEPYTIDNKSASLWYKQEADIPGNLKKQRMMAVYIRE